MPGALGTGEPAHIGAPSRAFTEARPTPVTRSRRSTGTERMHMEKVVPSAYKAMLGLEKYCVANVDPTVLELVKLRASMVNGCAFCVNMHSHDAAAAGE